MKHPIKTELIRGYCAQPLRFSCNWREWAPNPRAPRLGPRPFSTSLINSFGGNFVWTPPLFTHQFQANPCRCSRRVASIIERIDLGCASNLMRVLISLTAAYFIIA